MSRKDTLRAMLSQRAEKLPAGNSDAATQIDDTPKAPVSHVRSGAVGAMGRSLGQIASAAEQARALVAAGSVVVEIPADRIDRSFVADRFDDPQNDPSLIESLREHGQQVPILVRPHPERSDRYQIAYGHRRVRALAQLGRPVRAVVRALSDAELVVAQGQENSARTDLTYIERATFAIALEDRGFQRPIIMSALNMEKTQLSRLISLGRSIPTEISAAIGPAPKAGRPRWGALAERLSHSKSRDALADLLADTQFREADSDTRFRLVFEAIATRKSLRKPRSTACKGDDGRRFAVIERSETRMSVVVDSREFPDFGEFLAVKLPELYRVFQLEKEGAAVAK